ncbi:hypothetical protein L9F63_021716, partial [Diploptera punctata]
SFGLPSVKPKVTGPSRFNINEGSYGVPDAMKHGHAAAKSQLEITHPLQLSEMKYTQNQEKMNLLMLRNIQGLHAPLRINMELNAAKKIGRLPFLHSSCFMTDVLTGRDEEIGFEDFLNTAEFREQMVQPHASVEKHIGLL